LIASVTQETQRLEQANLDQPLTIKELQNINLVSALFIS